MLHTSICAYHICVFVLCARVNGSLATHEPTIHLGPPSSIVREYWACMCSVPSCTKYTCKIKRRYERIGGDSGRAICIFTRICACVCACVYCLCENGIPGATIPARTSSLASRLWCGVYMYFSPCCLLMSFNGWEMWRATSQIWDGRAVDMGWQMTE